jgi:Domain of unknown function (DUF4326)
MSEPRRIQLRRTKGWKNPPNTIIVSRPSRWGNPHAIGWCSCCGTEHTREEALDEYEAELNDVPVSLLAQLRGKNLACWCKIGDRCHADILLKVVNGSGIHNEASEKT